MHDYLLALIGGALLGLSAVGYLYVNGRIAGISGMLNQILNIHTVFKTPAIWFLVGLMIVPFFYGGLNTPEIDLNTSPWLMMLAGVLVGFGTRMGSGCTSGHGICGLSRLSARSIVATLTFMLTGVITVYVMRHVIGGGV